MSNILLEAFKKLNEEVDKIVNPFSGEKADGFEAALSEMAQGLFGEDEGIGGLQLPPMPAKLKPLPLPQKPGEPQQPQEPQELGEPQEPGESQDDSQNNQDFQKFFQIHTADKPKKNLNLTCHNKDKPTPDYD